MDFVITTKNKESAPIVQQEIPRTLEDLHVQKVADEGIEFIKSLERRNDWKLKTEGKLTVHEI